MLDPAWCDSSVSHWLIFKNVISDWLMTPALIILLLAAIAGLPCLIPRLPGKRLWLSTGSIVLLMYFIATSPLSVAVGSKGLVAFVPNDTGATADAIVVLGRGSQFRQTRVEVAAELWKVHRAPLIFASGAGDASEITELLKAEGIPAQALAHEGYSRTTEENARLTATVLKPQGVNKILLVTDPPHILRSLLTFRSFGFTVIPRTSPLPPGLSPRRKTLMVFYEYLGLISYGLQGRFFPQRLPDVTNFEQPLS